jgi:A/G-specific adenine glycosylase
MTLSLQQIQEFRQHIFPYYHEKARDLPWRKTEDPYAILVSEVMLQQTQVPRVIEKYKAWIRRFPTHFDLAKADMSAILPYWTGLGYNRRALYLKQCADEIVAHYNGIFPSTPEALRKLPGIGPYTSQSICVFAYDQPHPLIETNVRTIYIHHFFADKEHVSDEMLLPLVVDTMDRDNPRKWFNALMDYGTYLKEQLPNPSRKSTGYVKQSPLKGSVREVRGWIMKQLSTKSELTLAAVQTYFGDDDPRTPKAVAGLVKDGLIVERDGKLLLK